MKVFALDTSGENCSCCVLENAKVIADFNISTGTTHSETLLPMIDEMFKFSHLSLEEMDVFSCSVGPGSFTGLRIGISTIKGFALSLNKPVIGVSTLDALAQNVSPFDGIVCSVLDAKNDNVYAGIYMCKSGILNRQGDYQTGTIDELISTLQTSSENIIFVGDGSISFQDKFKSSLKERAHFAPAHLTHQLSTSVAKVAFDLALNGKVTTADSLMPMYLKKSQAEREAESHE